MVRGLGLGTQVCSELYHSYSLGFCEVQVWTRHENLLDVYHEETASAVQDRPGKDALRVYYIPKF